MVRIHLLPAGDAHTPTDSQHWGQQDVPCVWLPKPRDFGRLSDAGGGEAEWRDDLPVAGFAAQPAAE